MSLFRRHNTRKNSMKSASLNKKLRFESLERKVLLAGDVTATLVGGDLFITGDADDNAIQIARDTSLANPGVGDIEVRSSLLNPTTINGLPLATFTVTGDVIFDFSAGGNNVGNVGEPSPIIPDALELPGNVIYLGGAGDEFLNINNANINGNVSLHDSAGGIGASFALNDSFVAGNVSSVNNSDFSGIILTRYDGRW